MKLHIRKKNGLTLTELIVACVLIGIVMIGVVSFSLTIKQIQGSSSKLAILKMQTIAAVKEMSRDASMAIGDQNDPGVVVDTLNTPPQFISFRHDLSRTPETYTDDTWSIYMFNGNTIAGLDANSLYKCTHADDPLTPETAPFDPFVLTEAGVDCGDPDTFTNTSILLNNIDYVAGVQDGISANFVTANQLYTDFTVNVIYIPGQTFHRADNPIYSVNSKVIPLAHSW